MRKQGDGSIFIEAGTVFPFLCPKCEAIVPFTEHEFQTCWACSYYGTTEEFDVEWEWKPLQ